MFFIPAFRLIPVHGVLFLLHFVDISHVWRAFFFLLAAGVSLHVFLASGSSHAAIYGFCEHRRCFAHGLVYVKTSLP